MGANKTIGQTTGHTDTAQLISDKIDCNDSTSTTVLAAEVVSEGQQPQRLRISIAVRAKNVWIKEQAASVDDDQKGIFVKKDQTVTWTADGMYFGEISAIGDNGTAELYVTVL